MPDALRRQLGPFELWQWLAIASAGVVLGLVLRKALPRDKPMELDDGEGGIDGNGDGTVAGQPGIAGYRTQDPAAGGGYGPAPGGGHVPDNGRPTPTTNLEWERQVVSWLIAQGIPGVKAASAIGKYLAGIALDAQEQAILGEALAEFGIPPEGAGPPEPEEGTDTPPTTPPPTTPPPTTPPPTQPPVTPPPIKIPRTPTYRGADESKFLVALRSFFRSEIGRAPTSAEEGTYLAYWRSRVAAGRNGAQAMTDVRVKVRADLGRHA